MSSISCHVFRQSVGFVRVPVEHVADEPRVPALGGDGEQPLLDDPARVVLEEGGRVHGPEEHAAVEAVPVVHHPAHAVGVVVGGLGQARAHEADEVRLDLEVDVVGVHVEVGMARHRGLDPLVEVAPRARVGVPQAVLRVPEHLAVLLGRGVEADPVHHLGERHLDVEVVLVDRVLDHVGRPLELALDDLPVRPELGRRPEGDADHLPGPAAADLVLEGGPAHAARRRLRRSRPMRRQDQDAAPHQGLHSHRFLPPVPLDRGPPYNRGVRSARPPAEDAVRATAPASPGRRGAGRPRGARA